MKILLASQSPRRKELLQSMGYGFEVVAVDCEERYPANLVAENVAGYLSELKAKSFRRLSGDEVLITADTIVALDGEVLGKPKNYQEASEMLKKLSGRTHKVFTGITVRHPGQTITKTDVADVTFAEITDEEIQTYISVHRPFDKAGAYGIQEWLGMAKVRCIHGSFYTIMGLPTHLLYELLHTSPEL